MTTNIIIGVGTAYPFNAHEFSPGFSDIRVARYLGFCGVLCRYLIVLCPILFGHSVDCPSIYCFWLPFWYLQTLLNKEKLYITTTCFYFIIHPEVPVSALTWFIRIICYCNLQSLSIVHYCIN